MIKSLAVLIFLLTMVGCATQQKPAKIVTRSDRFINCVSRLNAEGLKADKAIEACEKAYKRN